MPQMLNGFAFQFGSSTLKYNLQVLTKRYIDKKTAREEIYTYPCENICEGPIVRKIYDETFIDQELPQVDFRTIVRVF